MVRDSDKIWFDGVGAGLVFFVGRGDVVGEVEDEEEVEGCRSERMEVRVEPKVDAVVTGFFSTVYISIPLYTIVRTPDK